MWCDLLAGFTSAYDKSSNKLFERYLHAECRSFLHGREESPEQPAYDSMDRLLAFRRGRLEKAVDEALPYIRTPLALAGVDNFRAYNLDKLGNWTDSGLTEGDPAVLYSRDCGEEKEQHRTANNVNQVGEVDDQILGYDEKGNLLHDGKLALTYDAFNRLVGASGKSPDGEDFETNPRQSPGAGRLGSPADARRTDVAFAVDVQEHKPATQSHNEVADRSPFRAQSWERFTKMRDVGLGTHLQAADRCLRNSQRLAS